MTSQIILIYRNHYNVLSSLVIEETEFEGSPEGISSMWPQNYLAQQRQKSAQTMQFANRAGEPRTRALRPRRSNSRSRGRSREALPDEVGEGEGKREGGEGIPGSVWNRAFRRKVQLKSPRDEMRDRADQCSRARLPAGDRGAARRGRGKGAACLSNSPSLLRHLLPTSNAGAWGVPRGSRYRAALSACSASRRQTSAITQPHDPANMSAYVPPYCARTAQVTVLAPARLLLYNNYRLIKICYLTLR